MKTVNFAVIGAGRIGKMHAGIFAATTGGRLCAVVDRSRREPEWTARAGLADVRVYATVDEALADREVDAVIIATASDSHTAIIRAAVAAGKKVFCEKPVAFSAAAVLDLRRNLPPSAVVQVGFNRRFDSAFAAMRDAIAGGQLGRAHSYHIVNRDPLRPPAAFVGSSGGMLIDFNVHDFDTLAFLSGARVAEVFARGGNVLQDEAMMAAGDIDTVMINMRLSDGSLANVDCARECNYGYDQRIEVIGERGGLQTGNVSLIRPTHLTNDGALAPPLREDFVARFREAYVEQARVFARVCRGECAVPVGLIDAARALAAAEAGVKSLAGGRSESVADVA